MVSPAPAAATHAPPPALSALLKALARPAPDEWPAEPELKADRQRQDAGLLEQQDLASGAVLEVPLVPAFARGADDENDGAGDNGSGSNPPEPGDVVVVHLTVRAVEAGGIGGGDDGGDEEDDNYGSGSSARVLFTTRADEDDGGSAPAARKAAPSSSSLLRGGNGSGSGSGSGSSSTGGAPIAFRLGKGRTRPPRALELALARMRAGERRMVRAAHRAYGFSHPDCGLAGLLPLACVEEVGSGGERQGWPGKVPDLVAFDVELLRVLSSRARGDDDEEDDDGEECSSSSSSSDDDDGEDPDETDRAAVERRLKQLQQKQERKKKKEGEEEEAPSPTAAAAAAAAAAVAAPVRALVYVREGEDKLRGGAPFPAAAAASQELDDVFKRTLRDSDSWESARAPNEAAFALALRSLAPDGTPLGAPPYFEAPAASPLSVPLGRGLLPRGLELALEHTTRGERALFIVPARLMTTAAATATMAQEEGGAGAAAGGGGAGGGKENSAAASIIPPPPPGAYQVELCVELLDLVQVRDLAGDGGATKRRLREGRGSFPADCPLHDTTVRVHWRARRLDPSAPALALPLASQVEAGGVGGGDDDEEEEGEGEGGQGGKDWQWPPSAEEGAGAAAAAWDYDSRADPSLAGRALRADTGCGDLPAALELAVRLMTPGEVAAVRFSRRYAQPAPATGDAAAAAELRAAAAEDARRARAQQLQSGGGGGGGKEGATPLTPHAYEVQVRLCSFEREGYWQRLPWRARLALAERVKGKGNTLYAQGKAAAAAGRYDHLLRLLASTRDYDAPDEEEEEEEEGDGAHDNDEDDEDEEGRRAEARARSVDALRGAALANLAAAALAAGDGARALKACDAADEMEGLPGAPDPAKVAFRRARALAMMAEPERADAEFERAAALLQARVEEEKQEQGEARVGAGGGGAGAASAVSAAAASLAEVRAAQRRARLEAKQHAAQQRAAMGNFFARKA